MNKPMIVAELSCNHLGRMTRAFQIATQAAKAGADAFKVQVWSYNKMCLDDSYTIQSGPWAGRLLQDLYKEAYTPWEWLPDLFAHIRNLGMTPIASPFDHESVDLLESLDCQIYKIASFEITDLPLIRRVVATGKPMIISTGMATLDEIDVAVSIAYFYGCEDLTLLKCVSAYPASSDDMNLLAMRDMKLGMASNIGISDHSLSNIPAIVATAMGASVIEKHLTLSRADGGPDSGFSLEPNEFADMVKAVRQTAACIGEVKYGASQSEQSSLALRRSLYIAEDMKAGDTLTIDNLRTARPALGLEPKHMCELLGKQIKQDVTRGTPLTWEMV